MSEAWEIIHGDAASIPLDDGAAQLICTDPPYFRAIDEAWDKQWKNAAAFLEWLRNVAVEWRRVLAPNGTLYVFASPAMAAHVEVMLSDLFAVRSSIVWAKPLPGAHGQCSRDALRSFFPQTERIIMAEQFGSDGSALRGSGYNDATAKLRAGVFEPLRVYLVKERDRAGMTNRQIDQAFGLNGMAGHWFGASQWALPKADQYQKLREVFRSAGAHEPLRREYEDLRREYEDLRREYEDLRRPFDLSGHSHTSATRPHTDVWNFPVVRGNSKAHPCEKPVPMMEHIILTSSRPGDLVVDTFAGSGATGEAAARNGRRFLGIDADERWVEHGRNRLANLTPSIFDQAA
jgi:site-specific DNA-methyltransferase (adenine-specific)